jgi:hypothetical protein
MFGWSSSDEQCELLGDKLTLGGDHSFVRSGLACGERPASSRSG